jgi:serine/threonine-protein kinase SRPK3
MKRYDYKGVPLPIVRKIAKQILIALDYLHRICHLIHTDLKLENCIVDLTDDQLREIDQNGCLT